VAQPGWCWYDVGEFDFAELQKLPLLIHDGICFFVQSEHMEMDKIEISKIGDGPEQKEKR
jgi:hypothetical protein